MAASVAMRAVQSCPRTALEEFNATGLLASDLGEWTHLVAQVLPIAEPNESFSIDLFPGWTRVLEDNQAPEPVADAAFELQRERYGADVSRALSIALAEIQGGSDPSVASERVLRAVSSIRDGRSLNRGDNSLTNELPKLAEALASGETLAKPVPTGIKPLDSVIYGWQPTLCLIGADPGVGKSAVLVKSAYAGACNGIKSAFFSLEDPPRFIATRLVSAISRVEVLRILYAKLTEAELALVEAALESLGRVSDNIITFDGSERPMAVERLVSIGRSLVSGSGVQCIYVDHAGELRSSARDRHDLEVANQLSALRGLANATGIPVVVAMHMKRRLNAKPTLGDFANSAGAERKARLALALTREPGAAVMQAHILKQTNGPSGLTLDIPFDLQSGTIA